ncbi:poly [ADP-ribose] polymerase tankyrase-2-like [Cotesia glomerata]|uniref:Ankyrin repeat protein n=1 Tax=Cotesia glomerata TaxID=32391 RepID=A0AAV7ID92_COTGL|nr:poly [ADP-ribose] polymerase tankyrase-2-like [Cotesia glomerata]KAH0549098.1 hypothetical protein KQX54_006078 [Cotesia glomerata]
MQQKFFAQFDVPLREPPKPKGAALNLAITVGNMEIIKTLLDAGAYIDPSNGLRPLHWSIALNKYEIVEYLIKRGADINARCDTKNPVHVAAEKGHKEILELLIDHNAIIDPRAIHDAIQDALQNRHFEIVKILLDTSAKLYPLRICSPL